MTDDTGGYVDRPTYTALEAHAVELEVALAAAKRETAETRAALEIEKRRAEHGWATAEHSNALLAGARHRNNHLEETLAETRERLEESIVSRTRLLDRADRLSRKATDAVSVAQQETAAHATAIALLHAERAKNVGLRAAIAKVAPDTLLATTLPYAIGYLDGKAVQVAGDGTLRWADQ